MRLEKRPDSPELRGVEPGPEEHTMRVSERERDCREAFASGHQCLRLDLPRRSHVRAKTKAGISARKEREREPPGSRRDFDGIARGETSINEVRGEAPQSVSGDLRG